MPGTRVGRPPRVTTAEIAEAALAIGLDRATVRNVAERLGMSVPGLYHHVRTRDELLAVAAAHRLGALDLPDDRGQPWTAWVADYARFVYDALVAQPEVIGQIQAGTVNTLRQARHLEPLLAVLTRNGFTLAEAYETYAHVMAAVVGAASSRIGRRAAHAAGHPPMKDLARAAATLGGDIPLVHELVHSPRRDLDPFDTVRFVVAAIAGRRDLLHAPQG